ncbi:MAG: nucleoside kinase [Rikenellaceae bacterium]
MSRVKIFCDNITPNEVDIEAGMTLKQIAESLKVECEQPIIAAYVNNRVKELGYRLFNSAIVNFVDLTSYAGMRVYQRTISLVLQCAVEELIGSCVLYIRHTMGVNGLYCEVEREDGSIIPLGEEMITALVVKMREIIDADEPIICQKLPTDQVRDIYKKRNYTDKIQLLDTRPRLFSEIYRLRDSVGYFYGSLAPSTGYVSHYALECYHHGFYLGLPCRNNPSVIGSSPTQEKMYGVFQFHQHWIDIMGVQTVGALNTKVLAGGSSEMIKLGEALADRAIIGVADAIYNAYVDRGCRIVMIAGPSSSGKTTTAKRLSIQLQIMGYHPVLISMDNYFIDRDKTPKDENGEYDFEVLEAINLELFNNHLNALLAGESVEIPRYDFLSGTSHPSGKHLSLEQRGVLIIEGIHGLNPRLTEHIDQNKIFRLYTSCFTTVAMDNASRISSSDNRLIRRLTRDFAHRGNSAVNTLRRWASVRRGEEQYIFPFQENADCMLNTAMFYEIAVLKPFAERILREVPNTTIEFEEAKRLLKFLDHFIVIDPSEISPTSTIREFIGGSSFEVE